MHTVIAIILAAGEGSRIGRPKALLPFGERTLLEYVMDISSKAGCEGHLVVLGAGHEKILEELPLESNQFVINNNYQRGQTSSIKCALEALPTGADGFLLFPVDMPLVTVDECRALITLYEKGKGMIVVPSCNKRRGHPVVFDITYKEEFLSLGDDEPAHKIIRMHPDRIIYLETDNRFVLFDIDTDDDYQEALKELESRKGFSG